MNYLVLLEDGGMPPLPLEGLTPRDSLVILIVVDRERLASELEAHLKKQRQSAEELQAQLTRKGIGAKILVEWGNPDDAVSACLAREGAIQLK